MSLSAAVLRELMAAGLSGDALLAACERIEASSPVVEPVIVERAVSASAIRMRRLRERNKASQVTESVTSDADVTLNAETLPPPVSPLSPSPRPLTQNPPLPPTNPTAGAGANALDGEVLPPIAKPKPPLASTRGCRLPPGFPGDSEREWARQNLGLSDDDFDECAAEFRDYWSGVAGRHGVKCDWPATFRNGARKFRPRRGARQAHAAGNQRSDGSLLGAYQRGAARVRAQNDVSRQRAGVFDHRDGELEMRFGIPAE